jgi:hypothetical protein
VLQESFSVDRVQLVNIWHHKTVVVRINQQFTIITKGQRLTLSPTACELLSSRVGFDIKLEETKIQFQAVDFLNAT